MNDNIIKKEEEEKNCDKSSREDKMRRDEKTFSFLR